jgi:hypothetical protein
MSYTITSCVGNAAGDAVVLQTKEAGEVHLDLTRRADDPARHNPAARAAYEAWVVKGNKPEVHVPPNLPPAQKSERQEIEELKRRLAALAREVEEIKARASAPAPSNA